MRGARKTAASARRPRTAKLRGIVITALLALVPVLATPHTAQADTIYRVHAGGYEEKSNAEGFYRYYKDGSVDGKTTYTASFDGEVGLSNDWTITAWVRATYDYVNFWGNWASDGLSDVNPKAGEDGVLRVHVKWRNTKVANVRLWLCRQGPVTRLACYRMNRSY
ncbi:hypothetical protein [Streptomyces griseocarneus]|uniref:hypothetical protein n=1 Tax=Streptomyces griseocarneus TaxID=51201 RepID=UPI00167EBDA2|nr:hypothetical protein [Streptomyces griseocarneus]MBZ6475169.1 hypothetical protein [Streptomyces griseocarneus]GHG61864.1 hypothetical protein GCM10018779_30110 [Streptomyces griseocarneus]